MIGTLDHATIRVLNSQEEFVKKEQIGTNNRIKNDEVAKAIKEKDAKVAAEECCEKG